MRHNIFRYLLSLLFVFLTHHSYGQEDILAPGNYSEILFIDFVEEVEQNSDARFYFNEDEINGLILRNIKKSSSISSILSENLNSTSFNFYCEGNDIFLFEGPPLITDLPDFEDHQKRRNTQEMLSQGKNEPRYILATKNSKENVITVGREQKVIKGRKCKVTGTIRSLSNGEVLIGATVYISKLELGTITDVNGIFSLRVPAGSYSVSINHMAMKEKEYGLKVISDGAFTIELEDDLIELQEITVIDKRRGNVEGMLMGFERVTTKTMKEIPVVLGEKDLLKIAQMLPGVQNVGEGSSGFNVRGGSADQNMFYINHISIYNTSHLFGFFTAFSPDIVSDFSLFKNNIPAKYGGRIASVFEINTREGNKNSLFFQGGISPITGHISLEGPIMKDKVSFVTSIRSTYSDWILKRINDHDISRSNAAFYDGTIGINASVDENNQVKAFFYHSSDAFSLSSRNDYNYSNTGGSIAWTHKFSKTFSSETSISTSEYEFQNIDINNVSEAYKQEYNLHHTEARADFLLLGLENHRIEFGINSVLYDLDKGRINPFGEESTRIPINLGNDFGLENSVYVSDEFNLLPRLDILMGMRYTYYAYLGPADVAQYEQGLPKNKYTVVGAEQYNPGQLVKPYTGIEPRLALNYSLGQNSSFKVSYNRLHQYIFLLSNTIALSPTDQWKLTDYHMKPPVSNQISVGMYRDFSDEGINISIEAYKKWIDNIVEYKDGADFISGDPIETLTLQGLQNSYGVEFMIKKNNNRLTGWLSYTYSRSMITVGGRYEEMKINQGLPYPSNYDKPHSLNFVSNFRISRRLSISSNLVYSTGRPITIPVAVYYSDMSQYLYYSDRNAYRIPDYFRIDLSVNIEGNLKFKKIAHSYWMLNVYNLTGRDNTYSIFYEARNGMIQGYKLSIFAQPVVTLSWNFKFGNYNSD